jgi:hypothetical protein
MPLAHFGSHDVPGSLPGSGCPIRRVARARANRQDTGTVHQKKDMSVEDIFAMREDGLGWGQIKKQLGVKPGGGSPDDRPDDGPPDNEIR